MIHVHKLVKNYGSVRAVDGISFDIARGEVVGFLGPNGAGKTTTMRIMTTYLSRDSGTVKIAHHDLDEAPLSVRRAIGYLPESAPLYQDMTVVDSLEFFAKMRGLGRSDRRRRVREMIEVCGLTSMVTREVSQLSKGYRQRVGLGQALIHDPEILILDEPTSGLDPNQIVEIREVITRIGEKKTVILSSHILSEVQATCRRVLIIDGGRLVADDRTETLILSGHGALRFVVTLKPGEHAEVVKTIKSLDAVEDIRERPREGEWRCFEVWGRQQDPFELGEVLSSEAARQNWPMAEMRREVGSLEDVFKNLTRGEA